MYHFYNQEKKSCFHFVKIKKIKVSRIYDSDPVFPLTSCQEQLPGKCVYLESEKRSPFSRCIIGIQSNAILEQLSELRGEKLVEDTEIPFLSQIYFPSNLICTFLQHGHLGDGGLIEGLLRPETRKWGS